MMVQVARRPFWRIEGIKPLFSNTRCVSTSSVVATLNQSFKHIELSTQRPFIFHINLNRPTVRNAFNAEMIKEISEAFEHVRDNSPDYRAVLLSANGPSFCAGADLGYMSSMRKFSFEENVSDADGLFNMINSIYSCRIPVIAKVHGHAMGGGVGVVAACDIALCTSNTLFAMTEVKLGIAPAVISRFVYNKIGFAGMSRYALTAERFDGKTALQLSLVNGIYDNAEDLDQAIDKLCTTFSKNAPEAVAETKALVRKVATVQDANAVRNEVCSLIARLRVSKEGQEGMSSFFEKRAPYWENVGNKM